MRPIFCLQYYEKDICCKILSPIILICIFLSACVKPEYLNQLFHHVGLSNQRVLIIRSCKNLYRNKKKRKKKKEKKIHHPVFAQLNYYPYCKNFQLNIIFYLQLQNLMTIFILAVISWQVETYIIFLSVQNKHTKITA